MTERLKTLAGEVLAAAQTRRPIPLLSTRPEGLSLDQAYTVAQHLHQGHLALGHHPVGRKLGLTYPAGWPAGITAPLWAPLYAHTVQLLSSHEATLAIGAWVAPKLEPEVVFRLRHAPRSAALADVLASIEAVAHGLEIVTSPFPDWTHSPADSIATGACHAALLVAPWQPLDSLGADPVAALAQFSVPLCCDGQLRATGTPERVMGSPLQALAALVLVLAQQPDAPPLQAGEIITTGTLCAAEPFEAGQTWQTQFEGLALRGLALTCSA
ncbi:2-keto-4-pentenoate hydratase [Ideonella sp.]|jgi:2-keto-4-pentenoate hydratase|uniref:2-keto-4-pentenoate hydratase n=1 Tax=Ideonella sp. TaxID=1929293 RepID=UPI0037BECAC4